MGEDQKARCIYCLETKRLAAFNTEHVLHRAFGGFEGALTLVAPYDPGVCRNCNDEFGKTIEESSRRILGSRHRCHSAAAKGTSSTDLVSTLYRGTLLLNAWRMVAPDRNQRTLSCYPSRYHPRYCVSCRGWRESFPRYQISVPSPFSWRAALDHLTRHYSNRVVKRLSANNTESRSEGLKHFARRSNRQERRERVR